MENNAEHPVEDSPTINNSPTNLNLLVNAISAAPHQQDRAQYSPSSWSPRNPDGDEHDSQLSSNKRKLSDSPHESQSKFRRTAPPNDHPRAMIMTTVVCLHAAVAQKSYGSEKRFLCPPPVVRIETPFTEIKNHQLAMSIVAETGERGTEQRSQLDSNLVANFKYLHVAGTAKSKSFQLALDIQETGHELDPDGGFAPGRVWASFDSAPVTIISKPSKKTAKTRNISSCILAGGPVSLFNRINSQTVRTKYMTIEHAQLCASNMSWSAFNVTVTRRHGDARQLVGPQPVTYGSEIQLTDSLTGIATNPLIIRKVDKGKVSPEDGGPVSQMQKIALQRINPDGTRSYLSAAGPLPGAPVVGPPTPGSAGQPGSHALLFQGPRVRDEVRDGLRTFTDEVDDYLCWTIVGISKFQYTFFDASGRNTPVPRIPITPFPTLFTTPAYRPGANTIELTVSNFFYENPDDRGNQQPLEIWLGTMGPLRQRIFQACPPGPLTSINQYGMPPGPDGVPISPHGGPELAHHMPPPPDGVNSGGETPAGLVAPPRFVHHQGPLHTIVIVELPPMPDIVKTIQEGMMSIGPPPPGGSKPHSDDAADDEGADDHAEPTGDGHVAPGHPPPGSQALPLFFIRGLDGMGYHSGRSIVCENVFHEMAVNAIDRAGAEERSEGGPSGSAAAGGWLAAAQAAAGADSGMQGWTLRVV